jgi:DHA2 family multidrug resistance protein
LPRCSSLSRTHSPFNPTKWFETGYLIAEVIAIPLTGWLTSILSLRGLFIIATSLFVIASAACAASIGFKSLVSARIFQGFAGGILIPIVFSAGFLLFPGRGQALATTIAGVLAVLAPTVGPVAGGWITSTYAWMWLFLINLGPGFLAVAIGSRGDPATFDFVGLPTLPMAVQDCPRRCSSFAAPSSGPR